MGIRADHGRRSPKLAVGAEHFQRHQGLPGWIYAARNPILQPDVFKVGYTTATPGERLKRLNSEQRKGTSRIGFFELAFARPVIDAYRTEQALFAAIAGARVARGKEFFSLPLDELAAAIVAAVSEANERVIAFQPCPCCGAVVRFTPLPNISHPCLACLARFVCDERGQPLRFRRVAGGPVETVAHPASSAERCRGAVGPMPTADGCEPAQAGPPAWRQPRIGGVTISCPHCGRRQDGPAGASAGTVVHAECPGCGHCFDALTETSAPCTTGSSASALGIAPTTFDAKQARELGQAAIDRAADQVVRALSSQRVLRAVEGCGLGSVWLDFAVQVQDRELVGWPYLELHVKETTERALTDLTEPDRMSITLGTPGGRAWLYEPEAERGELPCDMDELVDAAYAKVRELAMDWQDDALQRFLCPGSDDFSYYAGR